MNNKSLQIEKLPDGWNWAKLGDICEIISGQSPPGNTYIKEPKGLPFFQGKADFGDKYPVANVWCTEPIKIASPGDILISIRAPVGPTNVANVKCCIGRGLAAIRCGEKCNQNYMLFYLKIIENKLSTMGSGSTFNAIGVKDLQKISIPLPSLSEQKRIVKILEEKLASVEKAKKAAEEKLELINKLPRSYLKQAFEGKL